MEETSTEPTGISNEKNKDSISFFTNLGWVFAILLLIVGSFIGFLLLLTQMWLEGSLTLTSSICASCTLGTLAEISKKLGK
ncbi:MAG: hypothetical protein JJ868_18365 [Shimia sp.]|uniref:hypothetical protein n=1 Tax=Shimia sp. TaxID=1954381 RepID=UPI001B2277EE|nr:hypothetical protein [Shimia sp.]MBO6899332.1 hypothetical protein [Shimia sp.]